MFSFRPGLLWGSKRESARNGGCGARVGECWLTGTKMAWSGLGLTMPSFLISLGAVSFSFTCFGEDGGYGGAALVMWG